MIYLSAVLAILFVVLITKRLLRAKRGDIWFGLALAAIIVQGARDLLLGPLMSNFALYESADMLRIGALSDSDRMAGYGLIIICYASILAGIYIVRFIFSKKQSYKWVVSVEKANYAPSYPTNIMRRGYVYSRIVYLVGILAHIYILSALLATMGLFEIAASRALFSSNLAEESAVFMYAKVVSNFALIGVLGLASFSRNARELKWGHLALLLLLFVTVLYGGRATMVLTLLLYVLNYHLTVRRLTLGKLAWVGLLPILLFFGLVSLLRFSTQSLSAHEKLIAGVSGVGASRIDQAAWIQSIFSDSTSYLGLMAPLAKLARLLPGLEVEGSATIYQAVLDIYYGGVNYMSGIGGENYSNAAEFYSWGGYVAVPVFSLMAGAIYGAILQWASRNPRNLPIQNFAAVVFVFAFFPGLEAKLFHNIGEIGYYFLAIGFLSAGIVGFRKASPYYLAICLLFVFMMMWKVTGIDHLKSLATALFPVIYYLSYRVVRGVGVVVLRVHRVENDFIQSRIMLNPVSR